MDKTELVKLCSRSWSLAVLALMADGVPGRTSPLAAAAGCGRTAMQASVLHLIELGLLARNPGYGHPLRAEYCLTARGRRLAEWATALYGIVEPGPNRLLLRSKWSLPLISCLPAEARYGELRRALNPVTDRALSRCLTQLTEHRWISRRVISAASPPSVSYKLDTLGRGVHGHLQSLRL